MKKINFTLIRDFRSNKYLVAILGIILLASFFRLYKLGSLPPGLHPDEAANGLDIFRIQSGDIRPLYNTNGPRESLFFFLQGIFVSIFGNTILALRLAPAFIGITAVGVTYLFTKEWFNKNIGLLAAFFMASAPWAVTMSRNGFRASMMPLMIPLVLWLFTKSIRNKKVWWYALTGICFGAGFYTYLAYRLMPVFIFVLSIFAVIKYKKKLLDYTKPISIMIIATIITLSPLIFFTIKNPSDVLGGRSSVSFQNPELNDGKPLQTLISNVGKTAIMFNFSGDKNYRHNLGGAPMLNGVIGILFVLGILLSLIKFRDIRYFSLLTMFGVMLLPEILTAEGIPHGLRAIGTIPIVYIFASLGLWELINRWNGVFPKNPIPKGIIAAFVIITLTFSLNYNFRRYFVAWANAPETYEAYSEDSVAIANYIVGRSDAVPIYIVLDGYSNITVEYLAKNKVDYIRLDPSHLPSIDRTTDSLLVVAENQFKSSEDFLAKLDLKNSDTITSKYRNEVILFRVFAMSKISDSDEQ